MKISSDLNIVKAYWFGMWLYRIITFPELGEIYTDFLTNWTDTMICFFYTSTFIVMCLARYSDRFRPNNKANWFLYCVQINYEICLSAAVLGLVILIIPDFSRDSGFSEGFLNYPVLKLLLLFGFRQSSTQH